MFNTIAPQLVAMGTFLNPDTTRVIAKRIILTGHPFKVHKKTATVRYMFFNSGKWLCSNICATNDLIFNPVQMTSTTSNLFNFTPSMAVQGTYGNPLALMGTLRHISTDQSIKWTRYVCRCTSEYIPSGQSYGRSTMINESCFLTQWRSDDQPTAYLRCPRVSHLS